MKASMRGFSKVQVSASHAFILPLDELFDESLPFSELR